MALNELLFDVPNIRAENCPAKNHVRQGWMRAVCHLFHAFAIHSFVDELAHLNNTNYVDYFLKTIGPDRKVDLTKDGVKPWNNGQSTDTFPLDTGRLRRVLGAVRGEIRLRQIQEHARLAPSGSRRIVAS